jgi:LysM repeat protein
MKSRLREILASGVAPGFNTRAIDPTRPEIAVPKAFKDLEQKDSASKIARDSGFTVKQIKKIWKI